MTEKRLNVVILPSHKLFYLPSMAVWEHYTALGEDCLILTSNKKIDEAKELHPGFEVANTIRKKVKDYDSLNFIVLQHNSERHFITFENWLTEFEELLSPDRVSVTFVPDGFGNKVNGQPFVRKLADLRGKSVNVREYLSFGFMDKGTSDMAGSTPAHCIDIALLAGAFEKSDSIRTLSNIAAFEDIRERDVIFLPFRPWCTEKFQNGAYDFGSIDELAQLYLRHIEMACDSEALDNPIVLFRPDERFEAESLQVCNAVAARYDVRNTEDLYPQLLTLEPMLYYLFSQGLVRKACMICLDSTSFQIAPFLLKAVPGVHFSALLGARLDHVAQIEGSEEFIARRLIGKLDDFRRRYTSFLEDGYIDGIEEIDEACFIARIDRRT